MFFARLAQYCAYNAKWSFLGFQILKVELSSDHDLSLTQDSQLESLRSGKKAQGFDLILMRLEIGHLPPINQRFLLLFSPFLIFQIMIKLAGKR